MRKSQSYESATPEEREAVVNGCGPEGMQSLVSDDILGVNVAEACNCHDWDYNEGRDQLDRKEADVVFLKNMIEVIRKRGGFLMIPRSAIALVYFLAVRLLGRKAFEGAHAIDQKTSSRK